ncbi:MAG: hypothetical protein V2A62_05615 [Candidatus Woesearchaeota archaeon]
MMIINKKADTHMWWIMAAAVLALIVVILLLVWFKGSGDTAFSAINKNIAGAGDCDGDKIPDMFDNCPCDAEEPGAKVSGCLLTVKDKKDTLTTKKVGKDCCKP